ncbi:putative DNA-binding domain-containing protein [Halothiobacillus sp.]|uniref:HvfC family RiPP maturation protein n=1 Tax=Halothiobacillus sp. TaxID=1891311 RepID=UPI0026030B5E|nr:putative DNA-binding domain-containing protein [Halothiobacillus sp.]
MNTDFLTLQSQFTAFIRNPEHAPVPEGCDPERMKLYHQLFFNNFDGILESTYERTRAHIADDQWQVLVKLFFSTVPQHSPYLVDVPGRFLDFLQEQNAVALSEALLELAAFEATLHECRMAEDIALPEAPVSLPDALFDCAWQPHPQGVLFESAFPVNQADFSLDEVPTEPTLLWIQRDDAGVVQIYNLSAASARWLVLLDAHEDALPGQSLAQLAHELNVAPENLTEFARAQLADWIADGVLIPASGNQHNAACA